MIEDRAETDQKKEEIIHRLLDVWKAMPELRLGQLISNAVCWHTTNDPFFIEDFELIKLVERLAEKFGKKGKKNADIGEDTKISQP